MRWQVGWSWERVIPMLEAAQHRVLTPVLSGMGSNPATEPPFAVNTLGQWADFTANLVCAHDEPVFLWRRHRYADWWGLARYVRRFGAGLLRFVSRRRHAGSFAVGFSNIDVGPGASVTSPFDHAVGV